MASNKERKSGFQDRPKLQKFLADSGLCSRRKGETLILEGVVKVNGVKAELGDRVNPTLDLIQVRGKKLKPNLVSKVTLMINKPKGFTCSNEDKYAEKLIFELLNKKHSQTRLHCSGRLDVESEGLVILTNDGNLSHRLSHPSHQVTKRYLVEINRKLEKDDFQKLISGIEVEGEFLRLDQIRQKNGSPIGSTNFEISMGHGKKREIRRAFLKLGYRVKKLKRFAIGKLYLDKLPLGSYRILDRKEIDLLFVG